MKTSIKISKDLQRELLNRKIDSKDTYEGVIWDLIENTLPVNTKTKKQIEKSRLEIKAGKFYTLEEAKGYDLIENIYEQLEKVEKKK
jgi:hypothetical protein